MDIFEVVKGFIKPELLILVLVLYFLGMGIKSTQFIPDKFIPVMLGIFSVVMCLVWVIATTPQILDYKSMLLAVFVSTTQGILLAGASVYVNQLFKQAKKTE